MPGRIDGIETVPFLKDDPETKGLPIILLTGKRQEIDKKEGTEAGADDYLVKHLSPLELIKKVGRFLV